MSGVYISKNKKKLRNTIIRLITAVLLIVSVLFALKGFGFFNKSVVYKPVSDEFYNSSVSPSGQSSYAGSGRFETVSVGDESNNDATFNDGVIGPRTGRTEIIGDGKDKFTVMIYMCGSDTESIFGLASDDIDEMKSATKSGKLNIIIQTGGTENWNNSDIKSGTCQRFKVSKGNISKLETLNDSSMSNYANLTSFLQFCKEKYPADRYALIFWGHGGGTAGGFGYDEISTPTASMTIDDINQSLYASEMKFDFIGFDAGYSATYDIAYIMNFYADYLIASQEAVPSCGWNYTGWLSAIAENTSLETPEIAEIIIDDYISDCNQESAAASLTLIDLKDFNNLVVPSMVSFSESLDSHLSNGGYSDISRARVASREFCSDEIDLMEFAARINSDESNKLIDSLKTSVKYNGTSDKLINTNGISFYFPFNDLDNLNYVLNIFDKININEEYVSAVSKFANISLGGRLYCDDSQTHLINNGLTEDEYNHFKGIMQSESVSSKYKWADIDLINNYADYYSSNKIDPSTFEIVKETIMDGDVFNVFAISDKDRNLIADITVEAYAYDEQSSRYRFIGSDLSALDYLNDDRAHLIANYDSTWLSVNGADLCAQLISAQSYDSDKKLTYRVPVIISHTDVQDDQSFASVNEDAKSIKFEANIYITLTNYSGGFTDTYKISHAEIVHEYSGIPSPRSKTLKLTEGDVIVPLHTYADEHFSLIDTVASGSDMADSFIYSDDTKVTLKDMSEQEGFCSYMVFTDIYGNIYRTKINENVQ